MANQKMRKAEGGRRKTETQERSRRELEAMVRFCRLAWDGERCELGRHLARIELRAMPDVFESGTGPALCKIEIFGVAVTPRWAHLKFNAHAAVFHRDSGAIGSIQFRANWSGVTDGAVMIYAGKSRLDFDFRPAAETPGQPTPATPARRRATSSRKENSK